MKIRMILLALAAAGAATLAGPGAASAQSTCTVKCQCFHYGCGCQSSGGNGAQCDASGNGCVVTKCKAEVEPQATLSPGGGTRFAAWEKTAPGVAVRRNCAGLVVARYYGRTAAAAVRKRTSLLVI